MANIEKYIKKDGSAAYRFNAYLGVNPITGKKKRTTRRGFKTQKEAKLELSRLMLNTHENGIKMNENMTYREVYEEWFEQHSREVKVTTQDAIRHKFSKQILSNFGHLKIKAITRSYCQKVVNQWAEELKTFNDYKIQCNLVFKYAVRSNIITHNPMEHVTLPKKKNEIHYDMDEEEKKNYLTREELKLFLERFKGDIMSYTMFRLLAFTGARKGEIYALQWNDIDFTKQTASLKKTLISSNGKKSLQTSKTASSRRVISLDKETLSILKTWRKEQMERYMRDSLSFSTSGPQPMFTFYNHITRKTDYCRSTHLNDKLNNFYEKNPDLPRINVHGFRHTHASLLFDAGASIKDVQVRLGHSDIKTTMNIYTHVTDEAKEKTADLFQKFMSF